MLKLVVVNDHKKSREKKFQKTVSVKNKRQKLYITCSMCDHYNTLSGECKVTGENVSKQAFQHAQASPCEKNGNFVRYANVLPDGYNYYNDDEEIPITFRHDFSNCPKDDEGHPLFVNTKRGIERAVPIDDKVNLKADLWFGVPRVLTKQGQRELIHDLGLELAEEEAKKLGVPLYVDKDLQDSIGNKKEIEFHLIRQCQKNESEEKRQKPKDDFY